MKLYHVINSTFRCKTICSDDINMWYDKKTNAHPPSDSWVDIIKEDNSLPLWEDFK